MKQSNLDRALKTKTRLQGSEWHNLRKTRHLKLVCISKSLNGNYRADVLDEYFNHYYHWLNPQEANNLKKSDYYKNKKVYASSEIYTDNYKLLKTLITNSVIEMEVASGELVDIN